MSDARPAPDGRRVRRGLTTLSLIVGALIVAVQVVSLTARSNVHEAMASLEQAQGQASVSAGAAIEAHQTVVVGKEWLAGGGGFEDVELWNSLVRRQLNTLEGELLPALDAPFDELREASDAIRAITEAGEENVDRPEFDGVLDDLGVAARRLNNAGESALFEPVADTVRRQQAFTNAEMLLGIGLGLLTLAVLVALRRRASGELAAVSTMVEVQAQRRVDDERRHREHASILEAIAGNEPTTGVHRRIISFLERETGTPWEIVDGELRGERPIPSGLLELGQGLIETTARRDRADDLLTVQARTDQVTGLANRTALVERLDRDLRRFRRDPFNASLLMLDLDRFKAVNDVLGHAAGDEVLDQVGKIIRAQVRDSDVIARYGGDEFICVLYDCDEALARDVAERIGFWVDGPLIVSEGSADVGASFGLVDVAVVFGQDRTDHVDALLTAAELAMHEAKRTDRTVVTFSPSLADAAAERRATAAELRVGIERGEVICHYQPVLGLQSGAVTGVEALARWQHGDELRMPGDFIQIAEEHGLIAELGDGVVRRAAEQLATWQRAGIPATVAVNVSGLQLRRDDFVDRLEDALDAHGAQASGLVIEVTESVLLSDVEQAAGTLEAVRALGAEVAVDDFGTGYSSLASLQDLPIDILKIDRSFVSRLEDAKAQKIVAAIVGLAKALQLRTIAEGVEQAEQADLLRDLGCDEAQGFLWSRPVPIGELALGSRSIELRTA
ncbi:MAG: bifunctional diguanylate cyclase/phosphodiesterase [Actinomycetota bacterium]